ncbi:putative protein YjdF [bioreactor metagenome]|uniref:DUF2992 domain-containing protein n=1 Tax=bioreactor metagenome TaxID=1076179 RepID=A0A644W7V9_9ZZZZ
MFFEDPFWVGIFERFSDGTVQVCKITFGPEPKDFEIYGYLLDNWHKLTFSPPVKTDVKPEAKPNPKGLRRAIGKQLDSRGVGTKSQQALKLQQEEGKEARKEKSKQRKEEETQFKFELKQRKRKEKHRGR